MSTSSVLADTLLHELDDSVVHAQQCTWMLRKKDKLISKGIRAVVVGRFGIYLIHAKKIQVQWNLLDVKVIVSESDDVLEFVSDSPTQDRLILGRVPDDPLSLDLLLNATRRAVRSSCPGRFERGHYCRTDVSPIDRLDAIDDIAVLEAPPCDALTASYRAECHRRRERCSPAVLRTLRNYVMRVRAGDSTFDVADCSVFRDPRVFAPLAGVMAYNRWCTTFIARDSPLLRFSIAPALESNCHLTRLVLINVGATRDDATALATAMQANQRLALRELDLSQNNIEDRGITALSNWLSKMREGIVRLRLAECGAGRQGLALLLTTLENHHYHASTLHELDLSHNRAGEETNRSLQSFLRKASVLECLRLAQMGTLDVEVCMRAELASSFCLALRTLDLSGNRLPDNIDEMPNFATFLNAAPQLVELSLASTHLSVSTLVELVSRMRALVVLDLGENGAVVDNFRDLTALLRASFTLQQLHLSGVHRVKSKNAREFVQALSTLISSSCPLVHLTLAVDSDDAWRARSDALARSHTPPLTTAMAVPSSSAASPLRDSLLPLFDQLARNRSLQSLDITGQGIGDAGAFALAHALRGNRALRSLRLDDNGISFDGFESLSQAMQINESVVLFEWPHRDVAVALEHCARAPKGGRLSVETLMQLLRAIQSAAVRNATRPQTALGIVDLIDDKDFATLCDGAGPLLEKMLPSQPPAPRVRSQLTSACATVFADAYVHRSRALISNVLRQDALAFLQDCTFNKETGAFVLRSSGESLMACERCQSSTLPVKKLTISSDGNSAFWCASCELRTHRGRRDAEPLTPRGNLHFNIADDGAGEGSSTDFDDSVANSPRVHPAANALAASSTNRSGEWRPAKPSSVASESISSMSPRDEERMLGSGRRPSPLDVESSDGGEDNVATLNVATLNKSKSRGSSSDATHEGDLATDEEVRGSASLRAKRRGSRLQLGSTSMSKLTANAPPLPDGDASRSGMIPPPLPKSPGRPGEDNFGPPPTRPVPLRKSPPEDTESESSSSAAPAPGAGATSVAVVSASQKMSTMTREERRKALQEAARARPKRVDKWGFEVDTMKAQRNQSAKEREKEADRAEKWAPMIAEWDRFWNKTRQQTKDRFRKGLPDTLRGPLWRLVTNSDMLRDENVGLYARLSRQESPTFGAQIARDLHRTFPKHVYFTDGAGLGQVGLQKILNAFALYDEKTGYTQGMGFVAGLLLIYMGEEDAFFTMVRLMTDFELAGLYSTGFPRLYEMFYVHTQLLKTHLPQLAAHFDSLELESKTYGFQWFSTLYLYALPFHLVIRIWDYFLVDRFVAVYSIALALLKINQQRLLQLDWEGVMEMLFAFNELELEAAALINTALEFKLKEEHLQKHSLVYHKQLSEQKAEQESARRAEELQKLVTESINATPTLSADADTATTDAAGTPTNGHEDIDYDDDGEDDDSPLPPPSDEPLSMSSNSSRSAKSPSHRKARSRHHKSSRSSTPKAKE